MVVTGTVTDQSDLKVNVKFRKASEDQEFGVVLSPNHAWEIQSVIQSEAACSARLERIQDKSHVHNKLQRIVLGSAYQTTTVEVAENDLEQASKDALNLVKKSTGTENYHVIDDGTVVLTDDQTAPTPAKDLSNLGAHGPLPVPHPHPPQPPPAHLHPHPPQPPPAHLPPQPPPTYGNLYPSLPQQNPRSQENPATNSFVSRTSATSIASLQAGDIEQRLASRQIETITDCVIDTIDEEQEVLTVMKLFKTEEVLCVRRGGELHNSLTRFARSLVPAYAVLGASLLRRGRRYRKPPACWVEGGWSNKREEVLCVRRGG